MNPTWSPESWKSKPLEQRIVYPDPEALRTTLSALAKLPPLVTSWEVEKLKGELAGAGRGERFLLQAGDCSERFEDCNSSIIANRLKILLKMSLVLAHGCRKRVIRVGRIAGQYAKPRSAETETRNGLTLPAYRGPLVNRPGFSAVERTPSPAFLLEGYKRAALTLNFTRGLIDGGFADLHHPEFWNLEFVDHAAASAEYRQIVDSISDGIRFMETVATQPLDDLTRVDFYTSHEGLHLDYEQAQTRQVPRRPGKWYNLSTHFPWIGDRTRSPGGGHVEYFRGIANPIGLKVGPSMTADELIALADLLNPTNEPGRLTLIHRFGVKHIARCLPPLIEAILRGGKSVTWCCDPMHGNTQLTPSGIKTRSFEDILGELHQALDIHGESGSILGGVHIELSGEDVTECIGGARTLVEADLSRAYLTDVDPRLNHEQALEFAFAIAHQMNQTRRPASSRGG
jgi:3-deoxy-7-phosphoheptulonate synthase